MELTRADVARFRLRAQQLVGPAPERSLTEPAVLDLGAQDTGEGALWSLACRGVPVTAASDPSEDLVLAWTLRGAPHAYRRSEVAGVAAATAPFSEADAAKRIFDAAKPLRVAGIPVLDALDRVAAEMRDIVSEPTVKGEVSRELTGRLPEPYLRYCRPCAATHPYEQPFRLAALRAGLELQPGTSPPVLQRVPGWTGPAAEVPSSLDPLRAVLRLLGPATATDVAGYLDAPVREVRSRWPGDAVPVTVEGEERWVLEEDLAPLARAVEEDGDPDDVRLLAGYDLFLQARDRETLVPDPERRAALWPRLGRPGAVLAGSAIAGSWRARTVRGRLRVLVDRWSPVPEERLADAAERLAAYRDRPLDGLDLG